MPKDNKSKSCETPSALTFRQCKQRLWGTCGDKSLPAPWTWESGPCKTGASTGIKEAKESQDLLLWCYQRSAGVSKGDGSLRSKTEQKLGKNKPGRVHSNKLETGVTASGEHQRLSQISLFETQGKKTPTFLPKPSFSACGFLHLLGAGSAPK